MPNITSLNTLENLCACYDYITQDRIPFHTLQQYLDKQQLILKCLVLTLEFFPPKKPAYFQPVGEFSVHIFVSNYVNFGNIP